MSKLYKPSPKPLSSHCGAPQGVHTKAFADTANPNFGCFSPRSHCWVCAQQDMGEVFSDVELLSKASIPQSVQEHPVLEPSITSLWGPCKDLDPNLSSLHEFLYCLPYTHWWSPRWTNHLLFTITATCITSWIPFKSAPHHSMMTRWLFPWARGHGAHTISYSRVPHGLIKELKVSSLSTTLKAMARGTEPSELFGAEGPENRWNVRQAMPGGKSRQPFMHISSLSRK